MKNDVNTLGNNERIAIRKTIRKTCITANISYLFLHIIYLVLFIIVQATAMIYIDVASILLYLYFFYILKKKKYYIYALCCGNEFLIFMSAATILCGFDSGFHLTLIGLCVVSFFTAYFSVVRGIRNPLIWTGLSIVVYITIFFISYLNEPMYVLPNWLNMLFFTIHAVFSFVLVAGYLVVFLQYAFRLEKRIMNESRTDELTKISNRYALYDYLDTIADKSNYFLAIFDIDDFKLVNDKYGHVCGDYILTKLADISVKLLEDCFVCRYGGEEFVVISNVKQNETEFSYELEKFRSEIEKTKFVFEGNVIKTTITIGASRYSKQIPINKWIELADKNLYEGKNTGKNKIVFK